MSVFIRLLHFISLRFLVAAIMACSVSGTYAQQVRLQLDLVTDLGEDWSRTFVDIDNDGKDDFCALVGDTSQMNCFLSDGSTFGPNKITRNIGGGIQDRSAMRWADVNGDGRVDICRPSGQPGLEVAVAIGTVNCRLGPDFTQSVTASIPMTRTYQADGPNPNRTYYAGTAGLASWQDLFVADVNGDGRSDMCYVYSGATAASTFSAANGAAINIRELRCMLFNGSGFDAPTPAWTAAGLEIPAVDANEYWPRGFYDFNGDGYPDFCRILTNARVGCTLGGPNGFSGEVASAAIDLPTSRGAAFVDINGDGNTDFCRVVGTNLYNNTLRCLISNGLSWETIERFSPALDPGAGEARWWVDINGDGLPDFCRIRDGSKMSCRLSRGDGDGAGSSYAFGFSDVEVANVDLGFEGSRAFCDAAGTGISTFCRVTTHQGPTVTQTCGEGDREYCQTPGAIAVGPYAGLKDDTVQTTNSLMLQARQPLLTSYTDGAGAETRITYLPMTSKEVYTRSGYGTYPRSLIVQPRSLIVHETRAWRSGTQDTLTGTARYFFKDLRNDQWLGSRGFRERWIFTEGSNTLDHVVNYQGLGAGVDASSQLDDRRELGLVKYQERYAVANGFLPAPSNTSASGMTARKSILSNITAAAVQNAAIGSGSPSTGSPFILLQSTTNTLSDTTPANPRMRYVGASTTRSWDWNHANQQTVALPTADTSTTMTDLGNVTSIVQSTSGPGGVWKKTTTNRYDADDVSKWILGRLTNATVVSEAPSADAQAAAYPAKAGLSADAASTGSNTPAVPPPWLAATPASSKALATTSSIA